MAIPLEQMKASHLRMLEVVKEKNVKTLIGNTYHSKNILFEECEIWVSTKLLPKLSEADIKKIVTVIPKIELAKLGNKSWQGLFKEVELYNVSTLDEAKKLVE